MVAHAETATAPEPLHAGLIPLGAGLLFAALATDLAYVQTFATQWETFSVWLITGGLLMALLAALALGVDLLTGRTRHIAPVKFTALASAAVCGIVNAFVHSRDGYTAVGPTGLGLSAATAAFLVVAAWRGWSLNAPARRTT
jgi:uncharacterized membrane protein